MVLRKFVSAAASLIILPTISPASAQQSPPAAAEVDDIVVIARSAGESLMKVPVAVTALLPEDIARYQANDLQALTQQTPLVQVYAGGINSGGAYVIRGIGTTADDAGLEQAVALYSDGVYIQPSRALFAGQFDMQQVEILKGPQALFFGRNSPSGVISLRSANPGDTLNGYIRGGYEFEAHERYLEGAVGGPITDKLGIRVAGLYKKMRGYVRNLAPSQVDPLNPAFTLPGATRPWGPNAETWAGRVTLLYKPTYNFTSNLKVTTGKFSSNGAYSAAANLCSPGQQFGSSFGISDPFARCGVHDTNSRTDLPAAYTNQATNPRWKDGKSFSEVKSTIASWINTLDLDRFSVIAVTGYVKLTAGDRDNANGTSLGAFFGGQDQKFDSWSQEVRLVSDLDGPFNFTLGAYYDKSNLKLGVDAFVAAFAPDPRTGNYLTAFKFADQDGKTYSAFGQLRYKLTPELELAGGVRYTKARKSVQQQNVFTNKFFDGAFLGEGIVRSTRVSEDNWSPEATLTWNPNSATTVYAAFKTGYLAGGVSLPNLLQASNTSENLAFRPEKVKGGEIGYKSSWLDNRLRVELSAYYYKYDDLQVAAYDATTISFSINNAAKLTQKGVEGSVTFKASDALSLRGSGGWNSTKFDSYPTSACYTGQSPAQGCVGGVQDLSGRRLDHAPSFSGTLGFTFTQPVAEGYQLALDTDLSYSGSYSGAQAQNPTARQPAFAMINAGLRLSQDPDGFEVALLGRNLTDKRVLGFVTDKAGGVTGEMLGIVSRGRQISLQGSYRF